MGVQLLTLGFYGLADAGLWLHRGRMPADHTCPVKQRERRLVMTRFAALAAVALALSVTGRNYPAFYVASALNAIVWTLAGFALTGLALAKGLRERFHNTDRAAANA